MCALSTYWLGRRRACSCVVSTHFLIWVVFFFFDNIFHILFVVFFVVCFTSFGNWLKSIMESGFFWVFALRSAKSN